MAQQKNIEKMNLEQLQTYALQLAEQERQLKEQRRAVSARIDQLRMAERVAGMDDTEKQRLFQALQAEGVGSGEVFGEL